ncbi:nitrogen fixation/metabolism regulation signal transduction histidine kinase [Saonia flava]|uniref:histidine kinase n=1 Tax=Saonia flava TaxID=523696 RepID=A0A846QQ59_9FLAO|nr:ATP-binding protein [Saonia flava]NJB70238.1 nitrogen fixation/metabolism regulation signal transduction histidine kinase [Saonia flava]
MVSRHIYFQLVLRIVFITASAMGMAYFIFNAQYILFSIFLIALVTQTYYLISYVNQTNRKIAYFFDAIKNEDFTLRFPEKLSVKSLEELNHSLNLLNEQIQNIHLKKQAQEQYYQEILKQANIGILTFNQKGHILFANPTVEKLLNHKPLNHIKQLQQVDHKLYAIFSELKPFDRKLFQLTNERERTQLAIKCTSIAIDDQSLLLVVIQDIHQELDEKETDSWVKLIRVLTHEIMNTITPITSISDSILKYFRGKNGMVSVDNFTEDQLNNTAKGLEVIKEQGTDLMSFVQSYRTLLSVPEPDKELVSAQKLLEKVKILIPKTEENQHITIETIIEPKDLEFFIDEKQITQVLMNLSKNALQSVSLQENGQIKIKAGINNEESKYIAVWDNGPGISPEVINEVFVPFFTTKDTGTGIGLSLSKQILHLHGGSLKVNSIPNRETVFLLTF